MDDPIRLVLGPYDGVEIDLVELFGGRLPNGLAIPSRRQVAYYDLDVGETGARYRFAGWQGPAARPQEPPRW